MLRTQTIAVDTLGSIARVIADSMLNDRLKSDRRRAFNELVKLFRLSKLLPSGSDYLHIGVGVDSNGVPVFIVQVNTPEQPQEL